MKTENCAMPDYGEYTPLRQFDTEEARKEGWTSSQELAAKFGVSVDLLRRWRLYRGFPLNATRRVGNYTYWHEPTVFAWARTVPIGRSGRPPTWLALVGHPFAAEAEKMHLSYEAKRLKQGTR